MAEVDYTMIFAHLHKQSNIFLAPRLKEMGINVGQFPHLLCVCEKPGITQDEIAVRTKTDKSTVAKMMRQLVDAGFVTRHENIDDRRSLLVFPTKKGVAVYPRIAEEKRQWHNSLTENLTDVERQVLGMTLAKIVE